MLHLSCYAVAGLANQKQAEGVGRQIRVFSLKCRSECIFIKIAWKKTVGTTIETNPLKVLPKDIINEITVPYVSTDEISKAISTAEPAEPLFEPFANVFLKNKLKELTETLNALCAETQAGQADRQRVRDAITGLQRVNTLCLNKKALVVKFIVQYETNCSKSKHLFNYLHNQNKSNKQAFINACYCREGFLPLKIYLKRLDNMCWEPFLMSISSIGFVGFLLVGIIHPFGLWSILVSIGMLVVTPLTFAGCALAVVVCHRWYCNWKEAVNRPEYQQAKALIAALEQTDNVAVGNRP